MNLEIWKIFLNKPAMAAIIAQVTSQIIKIIIPVFKGKKPSFEKFTHYGDIPSAHTAFIIALSISIALNYGWDSPLFAICGVVSGIIIYDILKLRTAVEISLDITKKIVENENMKIDKKIPQFKGHTPVEVVSGIIWGIFIAVIYQLIFPN